MHLNDIPTPAALVDQRRVERNCARMLGLSASLGVRLRPHIKTHKTVEAARLQVGGESGPVTVSTLAEARYLAAAGFRDITYAVPLPPTRVAAATELAAHLDRFTVLVDSPETASVLVSVRGPGPEVMLKVDCGYHRAGVDPRSDEAVELARSLSASLGDRFRGVLAHGGHSYACRDRDALLRVASEERDVTVAFAERLRACGIPVAEVSIGSTPTMSVAAELPGGLAGVTEIRPGNYVFFDGFQAALGTCSEDDCAFTVLATVIGSHPARDTVVLDVGALALSKDRGATHISGWDGGYGAVLDAESGARLPVVLHALSQEHGLLRAAPGGGDALRALRAGSRVRVLANHSCLTAALFDRYHVLRDGHVVDTWTPCRGW